MNLTNFLKKGFANIIIILIGLVMLLTLGFNQGFDFKSGNILTIDATTFTQTEAENKVRTVINTTDDASIYSITSGTYANDTVLTVKYYTATDTVNEEIVDELFTIFGYDKTNILEKNYITSTPNVDGVYNNAVLYNALIASIIALIACAIYIFARLGLASAFVATASTILDVITMLAFAVIFRLEISAFIGFAILATTVISIAFNYLMLHKLSENANDENNKKQPNNKVAELTFKNSLKTNLVFIISIMVIALIFVITTSGAVNNAVLAVLFGLLCIIATSNYITPALWTMSYKRRTKIKKIPQEQAVETE